MATEIWVKIGSGNGLWPDDTKPSPEPMFTDHQWSPSDTHLRAISQGMPQPPITKICLKITYLNVIQTSLGPMCWYYQCVRQGVHNKYVLPYFGITVVNWSWYLNRACAKEYASPSDWFVVMKYHMKRNRTIWYLIALLVNFYNPLQIP